MFSEQQKTILSALKGNTIFTVAVPAGSEEAVLESGDLSLKVSKTQTFNGERMNLVNGSKLTITNTGEIIAYALKPVIENMKTPLSRSPDRADRRD